MKGDESAGDEDDSVAGSEENEQGEESEPKNAGFENTEIDSQATETSSTGKCSSGASKASSESRKGARKRAGARNGRRPKKVAQQGIRKQSKAHPSKKGAKPKAGRGKKGGADKGKTDRKVTKAAATTRIDVVNGGDPSDSSDTEISEFSHSSESSSDLSTTTEGQLLGGSTKMTRKMKAQAKEAQAYEDMLEPIAHRVFPLEAKKPQGINHLMPGEERIPPEAANHYVQRGLNYTKVIEKSLTRMRKKPGVSSMAIKTAEPLMRVTPAALEILYIS